VSSLSEAIEDSDQDLEKLEDRIEELKQEILQQQKTHKEEIQKMKAELVQQVEQAREGPQRHNTNQNVLHASTHSGNVHQPIVGDKKCRICKVNYNSSYRWRDEFCHNCRGPIMKKGKHKHSSFRHIMIHDSNYCTWVLSQESPWGELADFQDWLSARFVDPDLRNYCRRRRSQARGSHK
jgi:hypothetical protein